jgi:hypothetical protein
VEAEIGSVKSHIKSNAEKRGGGQFTAQPLTAPAANGADNSDWLRLPKPKQRLWGMSRTTWCELCESGAVKSIVIRKRHAARGIRLVFKPSAEAYLKSLMAGDAKENVS